MIVALKLPVVAITPVTTLDWPGKICATFFVAQCPWSCSYCHNTKSLSGLAVKDVSEIEAFLKKRRNLLDGIVFSGGEPTLCPELPDAMRYVKAMGYGVALHTGGPFPDRLAQLFLDNLVDWVGLDYKAPLNLYEAVTGDPTSSTSILESIKLIRESGVDYEVRTTVGSQIASADIILQMARELSSLGVRDWRLQQCRTGDGTKGFANSPPREVLNLWAEYARNLIGITTRIRTEYDGE